jgi:hypothetical protein
MKTKAILGLIGIFAFGFIVVGLTIWGFISLLVEWNILYILK